MPRIPPALKTVYWCIALSIVLTTTCKDVPYRLIKVPEGFNVDLYTNKVPGARYLTVSKNQRPPASLVYVGSNASEVC